MSWVTVVWSMIASACLTLAGLHFLAWLQAVLVMWAGVPAPVTVSVFFMGAIVAMTWEMSRDAVHAAQLIEADRRNSQKRLATGAELAGLGFYELTDESNVTYVDERMRALCGLPPGSDQGVPARDFWLAHIHPDDRAQILEINRQMIDGQLDRISAEYRYLHPDGRTLWFQHLATVTERNAVGRPRLTMGVVRDITERKRTAQELAQQRIQLAHMTRISTMGQLASSLAHELNKFLQAAAENAPAGALKAQGPRRLGLFPIALGVVSVFLGSVEYFQTLRRLNTLSSARYRTVNLSLIVLPAPT